MKENNIWTLILIGVAGIFFTCGAEAMTVTEQVKASSLSFYTNISSMAINLLFALFGISFAWKSISLVLKKAEFQEIAVMIIKAMIGVGVYTLFIQQGDYYLTTIADSAKMMASTGAGISMDKLNPGAIMDVGIDLQDTMMKNFNKASGADTFIGALTSFFPALMMVIACILILFSFAMISFNLFLAYCEMYIIIAVAPFMFALGGTEWTKDNALKPFQSMIAVSVKIMILALIANLAIQSAPTWSAHLLEWKIDDWKPLWKVISQIVAIGVFALLGPKLASAIIAGGSSMSAGDALQAGGNLGSMTTGGGAAALMTGGALAAPVIAAAKAGLGAAGGAEGLGRMVGSVLSAGGGAGKEVQPPGEGMGATASLATTMGVKPMSRDSPKPELPSGGGDSSPGGDAKIMPGGSSPAPSGGATGNAIGATVGGSSAGSSSPVTQQQMADAMKQMQGGQKTSLMDKIAGLPNFIPPEGVISGAAVSHVDHG